MFDINYHNNQLNGFQKLGYIADKIGVDHDEIAEISEEPVAIIRDVLKGGTIPPSLPNAKQLSDKLHMLRMLFSSLMRLGGYSDSEATKLLFDTTEFKQCIEQPPWYPENLRDYLTIHKIWAARNALMWLRRY